LTKVKAGAAPASNLIYLGGFSPTTAMRVLVVLFFFIHYMFSIK
jgi:hypothetical protein